MKRRRYDTPTAAPGPTDVTPVIDAEELRRQAVVLVTQAEELEAAQAEAERVAQAERDELDRVHSYLVAVSKARENLAGAIAGWEQAGTEVDAATAERDSAAELVAAAEADKAAAWAELERTLAAAGRADLDRIREADVARAAAEHAPALVAPRLEAAEAALARAIETRDLTAAVVAETFSALCRLGVQVERPAAVPAPPTVAELQAAAMAEARRRDERHVAAMADPRFQAQRRRQAALAANRRELAARQAANAGAGFIADVQRAARG